ncbi:MAG TPA: hypothetical protein VF669_22835 [Tepidisphaeraceae bacterium]|jgi:hypothetical protein
MLEQLRKFFQSRAGVVTAATLVLIGVVAAAIAVRSTFGDSEAEAVSKGRMYIDSTNLKAYKYTLKVGDPVPAPAPSGKNTGFPAEECWWTKDGKIRTEPYYVLLNMYKGTRDPTFCPDCGRLVVGHNPKPEPGDRPPPTKDQYKSR